MSTPPRPPPELIQAEGLCVDLGKRRVLTDVSCRARRGELTAIIGPNGAGKSTLLRALAGLQPRAEGVITWGDRALERWDRRALARARAWVPQHHTPGLELSALEVVLMARHAWRGPLAMSTEAERQRALDALANVGLAHAARTPSSQLSGGEQRRLLLARAALSDAPWWLLDEPIAHLDPGHQHDTMRRLRARADAGGGVLGVLHDLNAVERYADHTLVITQGKLLASGPPQEVLTEALIAALFELPMRLRRVDGQRVWLWPGAAPAHDNSS